ncbi:murein tripeptide/oligopeptide ABC transporter ATP binding protein OppF [Reinekea marinisedimentorum]|uniref:Oligopeptide transport system ATP-binding protein n=1 Tax=Reinekea marinisedimentorum TaxID=230495 RepID=A0A4R3I8W2_9GAMM|nr:murein tripeptide/oligopeptide ABC transporter ATP binding protein OppF [Reinekea marinisedimentorum]TCS41762.1 oligopeptide transport system ATP-binding protein [Reinekea marinisedimentorum]
MSQQKEKILSVEDLKVYFDVYPPNAMPWTKPAKLKAVNGVSFDLYAGETLGIVGESGCGKSTLARAVIKMVPAEAGKVMWLGKDLISANKKEMQNARRDLQMIFQDPLASLNPRMTIGDIIAEPLKTHYPQMPATERKQKVKEMLVKVGLLPNQINRYPHEFSGGQCQRIGIARALILNPKLIICDEPVSALDVSIQAQIVNLLMDLQEEMGLSLIFIAHDLSIVQHISTRVMVLYLGNVCEITTSDQLYSTPRHPYTQALISAVPIPDPEIEKDKEIILLEGDLPSPLNPPSGCVFRTRCPKAQVKCAEMKPELHEASPGHEVACFYAD